MEKRYSLFFMFFSKFFSVKFTSVFTSKLDLYSVLWRSPRVTFKHVECGRNSFVGHRDFFPETKQKSDKQRQNRKRIDDRAFLYKIFSIIYLLIIFCL